MDYYQLMKTIDQSPRSLQGYGLNTLPSPRDPRSIKYDKVLSALNMPYEAANLIDYSANLPPIFDQGVRGACVAAATVRTDFAFDEVAKGAYPAGGLSVAFAYTMAKAMDGIPNDEGTYPLTLYNVLQKFGVCSEETMPYSTLASLQAPDLPTITQAAMDEALKYKLDAYAQLLAPDDIDRSNVLATIRQALKIEGPFTMALLVCDNFEPDPKNSYKIPLPSGNMRGGHAISIVGDIPSLQSLKLRNTWGPRWGKDGYGLLPYEWITAKYDFGYYAFEAWTSTNLLQVKRAKKVIVTPGAKTMIVDDVEILLDEPAEIVNNRMKIPMRQMANNFGYMVDFDGQKATFILPS